MHIFQLTHIYIAYLMKCRLTQNNILSTFIKKTQFIAFFQSHTVIVLL